MKSLFLFLFLFVTFSFSADTTRRYSAVEEMLRRVPQKTQLSADELDPNDYETVKDYLSARDRLNKDQIMREMLILMMIYKK